MSHVHNKQHAHDMQVSVEKAINGLDAAQVGTVGQQQRDRLFYT
jgi:hypothetical protein